MLIGHTKFLIFYICNKRKKKLKIEKFLIWISFIASLLFYIKGLNFLEIYYGKFVWVTILIIANESFKSLIQVIVELVKTHSGTLSTYLW